MPPVSSPIVLVSSGASRSVPAARRTNSPSSSPERPASRSRTTSSVRRTSASASAQRVGHVGLRVAEGHDQQQPRPPARAHEVPHQVERGHVGPVGVLEHEQQRPVAADPGQQIGHRRVQAVPLGVRVRLDRRGRLARPGREVRQQAHELAVGRPERRPQRLRPADARQVVERLDERPVGRADHRVAGAVEDEHAAGGHLGGELAHEAALARARLAADQHGPAPGALVPRQLRPQRRELARPPGERQSRRERERRRELDRPGRRGRTPGALAREQPHVQRLHVGGGRGAELVAQEHAQGVVGAQGLGDVAVAGERLHQEPVARLAERRALDQLAARARGRAEPGPAELQPAARHPFERLELELRELTPARLEPVALLSRQQPRAEQPEHGLRLLADLAPAGVLRGGACRRDRPGGLVEVDRHGLGQREPQALTALQRRRGERPAQPRQQRAQRRAGIARRPLGPEEVDELVAVGGALTAGEQIAQERPCLPARQGRGDIAAVDLEAERAAQPDRGARPRHRRRV